MIVLQTTVHLTTDHLIKVLGFHPAVVHLALSPLKRMISKLLFNSGAIPKMYLWAI